MKKHFNKEFKMEKKVKIFFDVKILIGILIICAGLALLLQNFGYLENIEIWNFWPLVLIIIGLNHLIQPPESRQLFSGIILLSIGGLFLLDNLDIIPYGFGDFWPLILILVGIFIIKNAVWTGAKKTPTSSDYINLSLMLGGGDFKYSTPNLKGGKVTAIMGGGSIDLREADIKEEGVFIEATAIMGGVDIIVPRNWIVTVQGSPLLGGYDNKTSSPANGISGGDKVVKQLLIKGTVIMGGIEIKN